MSGRPAALLALAWLLASCGGPVPSPVAGSPSGSGARPATPSPGGASPASPAPPAACRLSDVALAVPAGLQDLHGNVNGVTDRGELLVLQSHVGYVTDTLTVFDPATGASTLVVRRPAPSSEAAATSQVAEAAGDLGWVVWIEIGFALEHDDWRLWSYNRGTGAVREVAKFDPGPDGQAAPGWGSDVSLLGDTAAWSEPAMLGPNRMGQRVYVADLRTGAVRRLGAEAQWPSLVSPTELVAALQVGTDPASGGVLARPASFPLAGGRPVPQAWAPPALVVGEAASSAGTVVASVARVATADNVSEPAQVLTRGADGATRTYQLPGQWGPVAAGTGFLAWSDEQNVWIRPAGQAEPTLLLTTPADQFAESVTQVDIHAAGPYFLWRPVPMQGYDWGDVRLAKVVCP